MGLDLVGFVVVKFNLIKSKNFLMGKDMSEKREEETNKQTSFVRVMINKSINKLYIILSKILI